MTPPGPVMRCAMVQVAPPSYARVPPWGPTVMPRLALKAKPRVVNRMPPLIVMELARNAAGTAPKLRSSLTRRVPWLIVVIPV